MELGSRLHVGGVKNKTHVTVASSNELNDEILLQVELPLTLDTNVPSTALTLPQVDLVGEHMDGDEGKVCIDH